jgi:hypothetical protein
LADADPKKNDATLLYRATVRTKDGRTATSQVAAVFGKAGPPKGAPDGGGAILYRFKVRAADGNEYPSQAVPGVRAVFYASDLKWAHGQAQHGAETTMSAKVKFDGGRPVRFVVEHNHYGSWLPYATVPGKVKDGVATAKLVTHHPVLNPKGPKPEPSELEDVDVAHLRFRVELGEAAQPPDGTGAGRGGSEFTASELKWGSTQHQHGAPTTMTAKVKNDNGQPVRFVVEHDHSGSWEPYEIVQATVKSGVATAKLVVHHPVLHPKKGSKPQPSEVAEADTAHLRFKVELGEAPKQ